MKYPNFGLEKKIWKKGFRMVAGVDEVGRGAFAGPVVAGCVSFATNSNYQFPIFNQFSKGIIINDSKQLTAKQRELADDWIKRNCFAWGIGAAPVGIINRKGIVKATQMAIRRAISDARARGPRIDFLLLDAFYAPYVVGLRRKNQKAIVRGDTKSYSIAAASIIAKVYRDQLMIRLGENPKYRKYHWSKNKGYGTMSHRQAIQKYGITRLHRKAFVEGHL